MAVSVPNDAALRRSFDHSRASTVNELAAILSAVESGDKVAAEKLLPLVYDELRRLAAARLARERPGGSLHATELVHEAFLRLVGDDPARPFEGKGHFFAAAALAMRRILVDRARRRNRLRRGGGMRRVRIPLDSLLVDPPDDGLLALDEALQALALEDPTAATLVTLRAFGGLTQAQAADALGVSRRTADRDWAYARAWLSHALSGPERATSGENPGDPGAADSPTAP